MIFFLLFNYFGLCWFSILLLVLDFCVDFYFFTVNFTITPSTHTDKEKVVQFAEEERSIKEENLRLCAFHSIIRKHVTKSQTTTNIKTPNNCYFHKDPLTTTNKQHHVIRPLQTTYNTTTPKTHTTNPTITTNNTTS